MLMYVFYYILIEISLSNIFILNIITKKYFRYSKSLAIIMVLYYILFMVLCSIVVLNQALQSMK